MNAIAAAARRAARAAVCRRAKVGAVIVRDAIVVARGYNGTVDGASCVDGGCPRGQLSHEQAPVGTPSAGEAKCVGLHAEVAAIMSAVRRGIALRGAQMVVTKRPCRTCARLIQQAGIVDVWVVDEDPDGIDDKDLTMFDTFKQLRTVVANAYREGFVHARRDGYGPVDAAKILARRLGRDLAAFARQRRD